MSPALVQQEMATCQWPHKLVVEFCLHLSISCAEAFAEEIPKADPNPDTFGICISLETLNAE